MKYFQVPRIEMDIVRKWEKQIGSPAYWLWSILDSDWYELLESNGVFVEDRNGNWIVLIPIEHLNSREQTERYEIIAITNDGVYKFEYWVSNP